MYRLRLIPRLQSHEKWLSGQQKFRTSTTSIITSRQLSTHNNKQKNGGREPDKWSRTIKVETTVSNVSFINPSIVRDVSVMETANQNGLDEEVFYFEYFLISQGWTEWQGILKKFVPLGVCLIAVMQWRAYRRKTREGNVANQWEINCYCSLPLRSLSRCWGYLADKKLPEFARPIVYETYAKTFGVNLSEALHQDLTYYPSLADFFARSLKDGVRPISQESPLVSPCDGTVLSVGTVHSGRVEQVKGVTYYVRDFLGEKINGKETPSNKNIHEHLLHKPHEGNTLYQCVIYLAPGDYHRFHSPADWKPTHRRHFSGELLSVNPKIAKWLPGLFVINERAVYLGEWQHGFFSYSAVGATNVGSIKVYFDKTLQTNQKRKSHKFKEICLGSAVNLHKGDLIGEFRMGSTIVIIFEGPINFKFNVAHGQKVFMGETLGLVQHRGQIRHIQMDR